MPLELFYSTVQTDAGWVGILGSAAGLRRIVLPQQSASEAFRLLDHTTEQPQPAIDRLRDISERLRAYFSGRRVDFPDELDLSRATPFQRQVWQGTALIPYGRTASYHWIAEKIGKPGAARAVGQALGRNPLPIIIPCHRVVASGGALGGFTGGLDMKRFLLRLESAGKARAD